MENLSSWIAITQYQQYLLDTFEIDKDKIMRAKMLQIPENIPKCNVLGTDSNPDAEADVNDLADAKKYAYKIYNEYVRVGCDLEINISAEQRNRVKNIVGDYEQLMDANINANGLFVIFQECKDEIELLMGYSFVRYKEKDEFIQMQQVFNTINSA